MNVHKAYQLAFTDGENPKRSQYKIENGICWINIKEIEKQKSKQTTCYNMSVENDESYTVNNVIVHNCTTFSVAAIGYHRRQDPATGSLLPKTVKAARADEVNRHTLRIIRTLRPRFFFIENPMGGLRKMDYMQGIPRHLITYCQYGFTYRKATDIWTNHPQPEFLPPCRNGDPCHQPAPRGTFELSRQTGLRRKPKGKKITNTKAAIKREQWKACFPIAEREQAQRMK